MYIFIQKNKGTHVRHFSDCLIYLTIETILNYHMWRKVLICLKSDFRWLKLSTSGSSLWIFWKPNKSFFAFWHFTWSRGLEVLIFRPLFKCQSEAFNFHPLTLNQIANGFLHRTLWFLFPSKILGPKALTTQTLFRMRNFDIIKEYGPTKYPPN